jgi:hypothetical protein
VSCTHCARFSSRALSTWAAPAATSLQKNQCTAVAPSPGVGGALMPEHRSTCDCPHGTRSSNNTTRDSYFLVGRYSEWFPLHLSLARMHLWTARGALCCIFLALQHMPWLDLAKCGRCTALDNEIAGDVLCCSSNSSCDIPRIHWSSA